jgi:DNA mismatch repair protein MSH5
MPSYEPPYKRRKSASHHHTSSKRTGSTSSTQSTAQSTRTGTSRRSSGSSLQGQGHRRSSRDVSERPTSSLDPRTHIRNGTVAADDTSQVAREEPPDVELLSEIIMAVNLTDRGAIGCAYYVAQTETLYFMEDVQMGDAEMVDSCKQA